MVTTIKITCDGVFIQSKPYLTNAHLRQASPSPSSSSLSSMGQPLDSSVSSSLSSLSSSSASSTTTSKYDSGLPPNRNSRSATMPDETGQPSIPMVVESGNMTVVMRNNRRKIGRERLADLVAKSEQQECQEDDVMGLRQAAYRPSYHYMYLVRKVPASRAMLSKGSGRNETVLSAGCDVDNGVRVDRRGGVGGGVAAEEQQQQQSPCANVSRGATINVADDLQAVASTAVNGDGCGGERRTAEELRPVVDVDVDAIANNSDSDDGRDSSSGQANAELENSKQQLTGKGASEEEEQQHTPFHSRSRQQSLISSADFENWYLKKRDDDDKEENPENLPPWTEHVESRSLLGSCEHLNSNSAADQTPVEHLRQPGDTRKSPDSANGSSTTKRARRNSTGQIAGAVLSNGGCGMNLQSTGQTAAVGKGYHQTTTAPPQNSLSGECPWYLQNPGPGATAALNNNNNNINSNVPPPTAPLRQHKRPAPQPGGHINPFPPSSHHLPPHNQSHSQNLSHTGPHQLIGGAPLISDLLKPNSIAIHPHQTYQSAATVTQQSPKSPLCPPGSSTNSAGQLHPSVLMSTSLNSAHLSGHGHPSQAIVSNLPPAANHSPGGSLLGGSGAMPTNHSHAAMSTSLHSGNGGGHSPATTNSSNVNSLGAISSSVSGSNLGLTPNLYIDNTGSTAWPSGAVAGSASLSPTTGSGAPLPPRKCEVKLNAMPWFHGSISRDEAEHLLQPREDGLFLVRESTNFPGDYTLCVCFQGKVEHYRVKYLDNKLTIDDEEYFENLGQLVQHYEKDADGLCTQLVKSLPKVGRQDFCINSKDFLDRGWVIPESDLQLRESIGKGEFGDVMLGILRGDRVAVKVLKDEGAAQKFLTEASVMTTLEHENLVKFIGLVFSSKHIYLVTEYMSKGSLVDYLRSRGRQHITRKDQINFACDTCSGMEYLEMKKVVHRDLAARNVLISESCIAKVADFGLAREECYNLDVGKLPIKWTAPEALKGGRFSNKSDMWSFGILLWEIYSFGRVPYPRIPLADVVKHVEVGYKMEAPEGCPSEIYEMMRQAWDLNPSRRPSFSDLKVKLLLLKSITT